MSHLSRHQKKENLKKILLFLIGIGLLSFLAFQIGLKSLINATLLLNNSLSGKTAQESEAEESDFFGTLNVEDPPTATNAAEIIMSGETSEYDSVIFYINNTKAAEKKVTDTFEVQIGKLKEGENKIYVVAKTNDDKHKRESERYTVIYKKEPPTLEINTPKDGDTISKQEIQLEGKTDPNVTVSVNNRPVVVDYQGSFKKSFRLSEGENKLNFVAEDEAGNKKETTITIRYQRDE